MVNSCNTNENPFDDALLALRLKSLRQENQYSLDQLAERSGISRGTLSRLEKGDVSPTTNVLGKLCSAYGLSMSRLMAMVETQFDPLVKAKDQQIWDDTKTGYTRKSVSPPNGHLSGEVVEGKLAPNTHICFEKPFRLNIEHHLILHSGSLRMTLDHCVYDLRDGDCLRYLLTGSSTFENTGPTPVHYHLFIL
ncbi:helix-turn-helix domain-containing protein [Hirschia litorea]|uniref:Helix-turn-helix domain-containing protein n=1 Tax=Hirschia litorea TaxID=1199156 RepID=A0ABW2INJ7_9PROT